MATPKFDAWDDVVAFALGLPGTERLPFYRHEAVKVRGKAFVSPGRETGSFHVATPHEEKAVLLETDPDSFWQTPHYEGWPGVLVRYGAADRDCIARVIERAWWDRASKQQRAERSGERP